MNFHTNRSRFDSTRCRKVKKSRPFRAGPVSHLWAASGAPSAPTPASVRRWSARNRWLRHKSTSSYTMIAPCREVHRARIVEGCRVRPPSLSSTCRTPETTSSSDHLDFDPAPVSGSRPIFPFPWPTRPWHGSIASLSNGKHRRSWMTLTAMVLLLVRAPLPARSLQALR
jgi:hypothetical protein